MRWLAALVLLLIPMVASAQSAPARFDWPDGRKAVIVLTYDDAAPTHLDTVVPQLAETGLKATFFLNATFPERDAVRWREAARAGHELANHSLLHPCPAGTFEMDPHYHTEGYSVAATLREIAAMNTLLAAIDGVRERTYAVPCSRPLAGRADYTGALARSGWCASSGRARRATASSVIRQRSIPGGCRAGAFRRMPPPTT